MNRRLFFALWPPDAVRARLAAEVQAHAALGRAIPSQNLHVTLVFLGAVAEPRLPLVLDAARSAQKLTFDGKFMLHLERVEFWRRSSLVCLTAERTAPQLRALVASLQSGLREHGFEPREHEEFRPHVTLVRDVRQGLSGAASAPVQWPVESFVLVESRVGQRGSQYSVLEEWPLACEEKRAR